MGDGGPDIHQVAHELMGITGLSQWENLVVSASDLGSNPNVLPLACCESIDPSLSLSSLELRFPSLFVYLFILGGGGRVFLVLSRGAGTRSGTNRSRRQHPCYTGQG